MRSNMNLTSFFASNARMQSTPTRPASLRWSPVCSIVMTSLVGMFISTARSTVDTSNLPLRFLRVSMISEDDTSCSASGFRYAVKVSLSSSSL